MDGDGLWYKDAVIYEVHVGAFQDSNGDGKGDFPGLTQRLDYIQDLGATAVLLLPFYPSPCRDDGYDISNCTDVDPAHGTLGDFQNFLRDAHARGLRVITELVLNHTSDQHPWFQRARRARAGTRQREFYVWSDTPDKYRDARVIFNHDETSNWTWDPVAKGYYWHRFHTHQPDLNFDHPLVRRATCRTVDFWLDQGVDGLRLDGAPYLFNREGTNCEHLPETTAFLRELRRHVDTKYPDRVLLAETDLWPEDALTYMTGEQCQMAFLRPLMPRLLAANRMEDRYPIMEMLARTPSVPESGQWALYLREHDDLTQRMVTDEKRDYLYRLQVKDPQTKIDLGIRRRLAPVLANDRRRIELMNGLLFSLPGTPVIYYGDEIGMGDNVYLGRRKAVRTPMQWSMDRNGGFSEADARELYLPIDNRPEYHHEALNVEVQHGQRHSLLWWMRRLVAARNQVRAFGRGTLEFLQAENRRVLVFWRSYGDERILVVANLSRQAQSVALDLEEYRGLTPVEMLGGNPLPAIGTGAYEVTLAPYGFYWLLLTDRRASPEALPAAREVSPVFLPVNSWESLFDRPMRRSLEQLLPRFIETRRWFKGQGRRLESVKIQDIVPLRPALASVILTRVEYSDRDAETCVVFLSVATGEEAVRVQVDFPDAVAAVLRSSDGKQGVLYSAAWDRSFASSLIDAIARRRKFKGDAGELTAWPFRYFRDAVVAAQPVPESASNLIANTNGSFTSGDRLALKLYRHIEAGVHPEQEIGEFLGAQTAFANYAPLAGRLEYLPLRGDPMVIGLLQEFVPHEAEAWEYTVDSLGRFFERAQTRRTLPGTDIVEGCDLLALSKLEPPAEAVELIGEFLESARLLGQRTAELHLALANSSDADFVPGPFQATYRQGQYHQVLALASRVFQALRADLEKLTDSTRREATRVLSLENDIWARLRWFRDSSISGSRIRVHGNYNLHEALFTGKDFIIIDFEGDPKQRLSERRAKRPPFYDVAGMLVSFHDAAYTARAAAIPEGAHEPHDSAPSAMAAEYWCRWSGSSLLKGYLGTMGSGSLLPQSQEEMTLLLHFLIVERLLNQSEMQVGQRRETLETTLAGIWGIVRDWRLPPKAL